MAVREVVEVTDVALSQGVGDNALLWVDGPDGKPALLYVVDRRQFTEGQLEELRTEAQQWIERLNPGVVLRIV